MKCSNCGLEIQDNDRFCPHCGGKNEPVIPTNTDPDATVAVDNSLFKTQGAEYKPADPNVSYADNNNEDINATVAIPSYPSSPAPAEDLDATVAASFVPTSASENVNTETPPAFTPITPNDDLNATVALGTGNMNTGSIPTQNNFEDTVRLDPGAQGTPPVVPPSDNNKPPKKKKGLIIVLCIVAVLVIAVGVVAALMFTDVIPNIFDKEEKKTEEKAEDPEETDPEETDPADTTAEADADTTKPADDKPESEKPDSKEPESTEPDSEEPDSEEPDSEEPDSEEPESTEPDSEEPDSTEPIVGTLTEDILEGTWTGEIDIGETFEAMAEGIELPELPVSGTYVFDGNGTLTRTLNTEELATMLAVLAESNDSAIMTLLAYTANSFNGDKTFTYTISGDSVIIDNGKSTLEYSDDTLKGTLAGCQLELTK